MWTSVWMLSGPVNAGGGHPHSEAPTASVSIGPHRLPDGAVFLPKPAQRQMDVRTQPVVMGDLAQAVELAGKVVMDPNAGGKVQAVLAGRLQAGPRGFPSIGQKVVRGEVLATVEPTSGVIERANQAAQLAELRASRALAEKRLARLRELSDTVPRKDIEALESEVQSLAGRMTAVGASLVSRDPLVAPVTGVIASSHAVVGQVIEARELVFEVIDPQRLNVEVLSYDPTIAADIAAAFLVVGSQRVALKLVGAGRSLREQAQPILFSAQGPVLSGLAVGQPVKVTIESARRRQGMRVPASALMKSPSNQTIVWVKSAPERFEPRTVSVEPLDGVSVAIVAGLKVGDRIATRGASLINQIR
ncbi:MAG: HlyD family efflux transporter periplasmic adaptor subunit [Burkholderiaceae bacterium]|nr:HlyD family efflux transporter periplasmic adaptor subunit [Burkholderiaceae bacterium]MBP7659370.1 HlyD family efflux transporter periplasmic adaptor subunit [Burkholderiaceae bacterium]